MPPTTSTTGIPNRRRLLQGAVAAGVMGLTGLPLRAQTRGGTLTAGLGGAHMTDTWDARGHSDLFMTAAASGAVFDCLTEIAADGSLKGELAESWDSSDAMTWVFNLRRDVRFHNGAPFGPQDVIASLELHRNDRTVFGAGGIVRTIADMRQSGPHQVTMMLTEANADFPYLMSDPHLLIYPAGDIALAMRQGIGTGLYRVTTFQPGRRMTAVRVDDHYKGDGAGWFDRIDYIAMNDPAARVAALSAGRVDVINRVAPHDLAAIAAHPRLAVQEVVGNQHQGFGVGPSSDAAHLRAAIRHGIDRQAWIDDGLLGHGRIAADSPIGPTNPFYLMDMTPPDCDADRAAYHLRQAGFSGAAVSVQATDNGHQILIRDAAEKAALTIDGIGCAGRATEDWMLLAATGGAEEPSAFRDLVRQGRATLDPDRRAAIYAEVQTMLRNDGSTIIPAFENILMAAATRIGMPAQLGNRMQMDDARMAERWWAI